MLLVDDDQPELARSARTPPSAGRRRSAPRRGAGASTRRGARRADRRECSDRDGVAEALDEAADGLRRQPDLGHEHDHAAALRERRRGGAQVDLGLARAGDAVQQQLLEAARVDRLGDRVERARLVGAELDGRRARRAPTATCSGARATRARGAAARARAPRGAAACRASAPVCATGVAPAAARRSSTSRWRAVRRTPDAARRAPGRGQLGDQAREPAHAGAGAGRQHQRERARRRRAVLERDPAGQLDELGGHVRRRPPRRGASSRSRATSLRVGSAPTTTPSSSRRPNGHDQHRADADALAHLLGKGVVERPTQRARARERLDLGDRGHAGSLDRGAVGFARV